MGSKTPLYDQHEKAGAKIVYSTDSAVYPHGINAIQFSRMIDLGMSPIAAIRAATVVASELLGWEGDTGAIAPGYYADIIAVDGNPLEDISIMTDPETADVCYIEPIIFYISVVMLI